MDTKVDTKNEKTPEDSGVLIVVVIPQGLEPWTHTLKVYCSTN